MFMPAQKMQTPAKSTQMKSAPGASVSGGVAQAKSAPATRGKPSPRKDAQPPEWEDDDFDRAIAKAMKAGAFDEMIAQAMQDERDNKLLPL